MSDTWEKRYGGSPPRKPAAQRNVLRKDVPFFLTMHAIERFRQRVFPGATFQEARHMLFRLAESARKTAQRSRRGDAIWESDGPPAVQFVVRHDARFTLPTCTTVYEREADLGHIEPDGEEP